MNKNKPAKKSAFSLIELSVVILIIGILVIGVTNGIKIINASKLSSAQSLTINSPVAGVNGLVFWLEPSLDNSFLKGENINNTTITKWLDINPQNPQLGNAFAGQKSDTSKFYYDLSAATSASGPTYIKNGINDIPTLRFKNTTIARKNLIVDPKATNNPLKDITMFVVLRCRSCNGYIIDRQCINASGAASSLCPLSGGGQPVFGLVSTPTTLVLQTRYDDGSSLAEISVSQSNNKPTIVTMERRYNKTMKLYINGKQVVSNTDNNKSITMDPVLIGGHISDTAVSDLDISEVILIKEAMTNLDRDSIEEYLGTKYNIKTSN